MERSTIYNGKIHKLSMTMFHSYVNFYQRVNTQKMGLSEHFIMVNTCYNGESLIMDL
jgi:hypothetical protein